MLFRKLVAATILTAVCSSAAMASTLLLDRGLPTDNLNNAAGASRSNVAWTDGTQNWLIGDTFKNTSSQTWAIDTIRLWTVDPGISSASLWGGLDGSDIGVIASSGVITPAVTYAGGSTYQGYSGSFIGIQQIDFLVNITLAAGQTYDFFLAGTGGKYAAPFAHASNAALSGSPQEGADGILLDGEIVNGLIAFGDIEHWSSAVTGWDKPSDLNVQVFGNAVPEPVTLALFGIGLAGLATTRRKKTV